MTNDSFWISGVVPVVLAAITGYVTRQATKAQAKSELDKALALQASERAKSDASVEIKRLENVDANESRFHEDLKAIRLEVEEERKKALERFEELAYLRVWKEASEKEVERLKAEIERLRPLEGKNADLEREKINNRHTINGLEGELLMYQHISKALQSPVEMEKLLASNKQRLEAQRMLPPANEPEP